MYKGNLAVVQRLLALKPSVESVNRVIAIRLPETGVDVCFVALGYCVASPSVNIEVMRALLALTPDEMNTGSHT